jgi:class 3 adenylate cyclase
MTAVSEPFTGVGTVMLTDVRAWSSPGLLDPKEVIGIIYRHHCLVKEAIQAHLGVVHQFVGDAVFAYWHPQHTAPNHAQLAFDASRAILDALPSHLAGEQVSYDVIIVLGTGEMTGAEFGPIRQFQIIGKAMAVAERISRTGSVGGSSVRMSQYSADLISSPGEFEETGRITRDALEDLRVFLYRPSGEHS